MTVSIENIGNIFKDAEKKCIKACINTVNIQAASSRKEGIINVKNSKEFSDHQGLRGCWGTDWPVSEKDSAGHKRETVGLGICIPQKQVVMELPANKDNYPFVVGKIANSFNYNITFCSDNESWGYHSDKEWFAYLKAWKRELSSPVKIRRITRQ